MIEIWKETGNKSSKPNTKVEISNMGRYRTRDGRILESHYRQVMRFEGRQTKVHIVIAKLFIPKTEEDIRLNRNCIDHITHNPVNIGINDVRNLRWCTPKENNNFEEALNNKRDGSYSKTPEWRKKMSLGMKGRVPSNKGTKGLQVAWNKGISGFSPFRQKYGMSAREIAEKLGFSRGYIQNLERIGRLAELLVKEG